MVGGVLVSGEAVDGAVLVSGEAVEVAALVSGEAVGIAAKQALHTKSAEFIHCITWKITIFSQMYNLN